MDCTCGFNTIVIQQCGRIKNRPRGGVLNPLDGINFRKEKKMKPCKGIIIGAVAGDVIGSVFEFNNTKRMDFDLFSRYTNFTDDSVLTCATMYALMNRTGYDKAYQMFARKYPYSGYGGSFAKWIFANPPQPYNSWGNGSAMRVSPVGWYCADIGDVLAEAKKSAEVTHNHPEGIKGAQATAAAVYMARQGRSREEIREYISRTFHYNLDRKIADIRPGYTFDESCQGTVPEAITAFLESTGYENAIRLAISLGGDSDTIACITGGIAEAFYRVVPDHIATNVRGILPDELIEIMEEFSGRYLPSQESMSGRSG
jgi:ADP-ribosylglycohydrolase